jgi:hypothetical protein
MTSRRHFVNPFSKLRIADFYAGMCNRKRFQICFRLKSRSKCPILCHSRDFWQLRVQMKRSFVCIALRYRNGWLICINLSKSIYDQMLLLIIQTFVIAHFCLDMRSTLATATGGRPRWSQWLVSICSTQLMRCKSAFQEGLVLCLILLPINVWRQIRLVVLDRTCL